MFKASIYCLLLLGLALLSISPLMQVHADGGAPNLAYVAGASQGVGIIDVAQQKVTGRLAVAGDPYTILLSPDGRLLYVTQPTLGKVTALATKTKQAICSAPFPGHPSLLALSIDGSVLYVAGMNETTIIALDSQTCVLRNSFQTTEPISWLAVTGVSTSNAFVGLNNNTADIEVGTTFGVVDNLSWTHGRHAFKTGMEIRRVRLNQGQTADNNLTFASEPDLI